MATDWFWWWNDGLMAIVLDYGTFKNFLGHTWNVVFFKKAIGITIFVSFII